MRGTELCYHHSSVKSAVGKAATADPLPFVFPEDRASVQINFFLLLEAYNAGRLEQQMFNSLFSLLKAMARNLGRSGSLVMDREREDRSQDAESRAQEDRAQGADLRAQKDPGQASGASGIAELMASVSPLKPEECFLSSAAAGAGPAMDLFGGGFMGEREARRTSGARRSPLL